MTADAKIADLFNLVFESLPSQERSSCKVVVDHLFEFYRYVNDNKSKHPWIVETELDALGSSLNLLQAEAPHERIDWMPEYGCALMKSKAGCTAEIIAFNLISLDLHQFETRSKPSCNGYNYVDNSLPAGYQVLHIGTCNIDDLKARQDLFSSKLAAAQTRTGEKRSAAGGQQGHQKTPAFIHALYREVFGMQPEQLPRGGWTDVGMHTGGQETRPTAWPLVTSSLYQRMINCEISIRLSIDKFFPKIVAYFGLYMCEKKIEEYERTVTPKPSSNAPDVLLVRAFRILQSASMVAAALSDEGVDDMSHFLTWSKSIRCQIMEKTSSQSNLFSKRFELPQSDADIVGTFKNFSFNVPDKYSPASDGTSSESQVRVLTEKNIGWTRILIGNGLEDVDEWVKKAMLSTPSRDSLCRMLVLKTVECVMWDYAKKMPVMTQAELQMLAAIVDNYREVLHTLKESHEYKPISLVELKSREMLVVWVVNCSKYAVAMKGYGVPLDFNDLSHLVLSDPSEWDVALHVAEYLGKVGTSRPIFSLRDETPTFDLGRCISNDSPDLVKIWEQEEKDASCRVEGHWNEVLRKKQLARELRAKIAALKVSKDEADRKLANARWELEYNERRLINLWKPLKARLVEALESEVSDLERKLNSFQSQLDSALKAPPPVFQPLPLQRENAMPIIFFLHMPPIFQLLARFSFTSQQLRLPWPLTAATTGSEGTQEIDITGLVTRGNNYCQFSWKDYYNTYQHSQYHRSTFPRTGSDYSLLLRSKQVAPEPNIVGPQNVDVMFNRSDGVWYPDVMTPRMAWFGGPKSFDRAASEAEIDPFVKLDHVIIASNFTERLENEISLQWTLMQPGEPHVHPSRGNLPYARQNLKPEWLSKTQYLSFANLRSYPLIQLRNILVAIQNRQLPFTSKQFTYSFARRFFTLGKYTKTKPAALDWNGREILSQQNLEIKDSPRNYMCVKLIGQLCNFFSRWSNAEARNTAPKLAAAVFNWAEELDGEIEKSPPSQASAVQAKQKVLYQHAILVLIGGDSLIESDVSLLIKMILKSRNLFTEDFQSDEIRANAKEIKYGICQKLNNIRQVALKAPAMMTSALRSVIPRCPTVLAWHPWTPDNNSCTQCFEAVGDDGCFYSINLISGEVLTNGLPPSRLPQSIMAHPLYTRTFGDSNFEVVGKGDFLETRYPIFGRFYRFSNGLRLTIYEFQEDESEMLELLDGTADGFSWAVDLPIRLKSMHSHWLSRESNLIILRVSALKIATFHV
ncbi:hypothetical protein ACHAW5_003521 [Stephanodiscus triporus]|uniref:Uncharacterized protein n=1 Tax=Stephanodiscus triporus TaxID=2934178 RepID=A0ABD3NMJ2_9STRA